MTAPATVCAARGVKTVVLVHAAPHEPDIPTSPFLLRTSAPQLGLLYLAGALAAAGYTPVYLDAANQAVRPAVVAQRLTGQRALWIGVHANIASRAWALELIRLLRGAAKGVPVLVGGPGFIYADEFLAAGAAAVIAGEADEWVVPLTRAIENGGAWPDQAGIVTPPAGGGLTEPQPLPPPRDLDALAPPLWSLAPWREYQDPFAIQARRPMYYLLASRGCFMNCAFCFQTYPGARHYRLRAVDAVVAEMSRAGEQLGVRHIKFQDDNFGGQPAWLDEFCAAKSARLSDLTWHGSMHVAAFRDDPAGLARRLARAGCRSVHFGLQTTRSDQLREIHRLADEPEILRRCLAPLRRAGIYTVVDFIFGLPGETPETLRDHRRYILGLAADAIQINPLNLVPRTELWAKHNGQAFRAVDRAAVDAALRSVLRRYLLRPRVWGWNLRYLLARNPRAVPELARALPTLLRLLLGRFRNPWLRGGGQAT